MLTPQEICPEKVAIYIRWSTDDQGEGTTLETQLERCKHYLISQGWVFNEALLFIDDGYSGGSLDRPALTRLRADVAAARVACVVVYKIDRLSRSVVDIVDLVLREWEGRCFIKSTTEEVNTVSPAGKMFFYILVSFAEYERNLIRERTMGGKVKRAEQGLNPGFRPPFGLRRGREPGRLEIVPAEASVVRRAFDLYRQGNGVQQIAQMLNEETSRHGRPWNRLMIRRMLANPIYTGVLEYGRTQRTTREQRERHSLGSTIRHDRPRLARVEGAFPAIVEPPVWEEVQALLQARSARAPSRATYSDYLLSGIAHCFCGAAMGGKRVGDHRYYYCTARKRQGDTGCAAGHVPAAPVESRLEEEVKQRLIHTAAPILADLLDAALRERAREARAEFRQAEQARTAAMQQRKRLEADYRSGALPAPLYAHDMAALEAEEREVQSRLQRLERWSSLLKQARQAPEGIPPLVAPAELWTAMTVPERKELLRRWTASMTLHRPLRSQKPPLLAIEWRPDHEAAPAHLQSLLHQVALRAALSNLKDLVLLQKQIDSVTPAD